MIRLVLMLIALGLYGCASPVSDPVPQPSYYHYSPAHHHRSPATKSSVPERTKPAQEAIPQEVISIPPDIPVVANCVDTSNGAMVISRDIKCRDTR